MEHYLELAKDFLGPWAAIVYIALFLGSSFLIISRLERMAARGVQGTLLGTLFMPLFSGLPNLIFVAVVLYRSGPADEVAVNCVVNNLTNLTLLLGLPALIWGLDLRFFMLDLHDPVESHAHSSLNRLSIKLSIIALLFFTSGVFFLSNDGVLNRDDGCVLICMFIFWQIFHVYEVLRENARGSGGWGVGIISDLGFIFVGAVVTLFSVDGVVSVILESDMRYMGGNTLGLLTGWLMVVPNGLLAFYYAMKKKADVVYSSQIGDGHICIPLCLGVFAAFRDLPVGSNVVELLLLIMAGGFIHLFCLASLKRLPSLLAFSLVGFYGFFIFRYWGSL